MPAAKLCLEAATLHKLAASISLSPSPHLQSFNMSGLLLHSEIMYYLLYATVFIGVQ